MIKFVNLDNKMMNLFKSARYINYKYKIKRKLKKKCKNKRIIKLINLQEDIKLGKDSMN